MVYSINMHYYAIIIGQKLLHFHWGTRQDEVYIRNKDSLHLMSACKWFF